MLTHEIVRYKPVKEKKPKFSNGSGQHREFIFQRHLQASLKREDINYGEQFYIKKFKEEGVVINIIDEIKQVEWDGLKPKFIELWFNKLGTSHLFHPNDLR